MRPLLGNAANNQEATIEELLKAMFSMWSAPRLYNEGQQQHQLPHLGICSGHPPPEIVAPAKQGSLHHWKFSKVHTGPRFAHGFQSSLCVRLYKKIMQATSRGRTKS
jgi:hypothetical protein